MAGTDGAATRTAGSPSPLAAADDPVGSVTTDAQIPTESLVSEFALEHEDLVLSPTLAAVPNVTVRPDGAPIRGFGNDYLFIQAFGDAYEAFEAALDDDHTVGDVTTVGSFDGHRVYRVQLTDEAMTVSSLLSALAVRMLDVESERGAWRLRVQLPNREALSAFRDHCLEQDISLDVRKLLQPDGDGVDATVGLDDHQRETLLAAFASGYYDVPRTISQEELAAHIGISPSAISQRLRVAVGRLVEETIAPEDLPKKSAVSKGN